MYSMRSLVVRFVVLVKTHANLVITKNLAARSKLKTLSQFDFVLTVLMSLFISLTEVIAFEIVSKWLILSDVVKIDTAFTSAEERQQLLLICESDALLCEYPGVLKNLGVKWISIRNISLKIISITFECFTTEWFTEYPINISNVEELNIFRHTDRSLFVADLVNKCKKLKKLSFENSYDNIQNIHKEILENLNILDINSVFTERNSTDSFCGKGKESFHYLVESCKNLTQINYSNYFFAYGPDTTDGVKQNDFIELLKVNPNIKVIDNVCLYSGTDEIFSAISRYCQKIESLYISFLDDPFNVSAVADMILMCPTLSYVEIEHDADEGFSYGNFRYSKKVRNDLEHPRIKNCEMRANENVLYTRSLDFQVGELESTLQKLGGLDSIEIVDSADEPITGELLRIIGTKNPALHTLKITACSFGDTVTSSDLLHLLTHCPTLHTIKLHGLNVISDAELCTLFSAPHPNLTDLSLAMHNTLSVATVDSILSANKLKRLCVHFCKEFSILALISKYPAELELYEMDNDECLAAMAMDSDGDDDGSDSSDDGSDSSGESDGSDSGSDDESDEESDNSSDGSSEDDSALVGDASVDQEQEE